MIIYYIKRQHQLKYEVQLANLKTAQEKELHEKRLSFFTNVSHEVRTPLTLIINPIKELLLHNGKNYDVVDMTSVYRNSRRLLSMVDQLLLFRTAEDENAALDFSRFDLVDTAREVFLCFNNQAKEKSIDFTFDATPEIIEISADREKVEIILFNLLSNAVKFTPAKGFVKISLKLNETNAQIMVSDSGPGIAPDIQDRLFDRFFKNRKTSESQQAGFGIGLFLSRKFVEMHGGSIHLSSTLNQGCIFKVLLPVNLLKGSQDGQNLLTINSSSLVKELNWKEEQPVKAMSTSHLHTIVDEKQRVLLIDDDGDLRNYLQQLLSNTYTVYEAANGKIGLELMTQKEPDLVICDVIMPEMDGIDFCRAIKSNEAVSHTPVILLTSSSSTETQLKGIQCGADDYVQKPFENQLLLARVDSLLKGRKALKQYFFNEITLKKNSVKIPEEFSLFLKKCIAIIEDHLEDEDFGVKNFAIKMDTSQSSLLRKVKSISGLSVNEFIRFIRLRKAAELMVSTDLQIKEVAYRVGFQQLAYFRSQFTKLFEMTPSNFIAKHRKNVSEKR